MLAKFHDWNVIRKIGSGSYGTVYELERTNGQLTERAALKVISVPSSSEELESLKFKFKHDEAAVTNYLKEKVRKTEEEIALLYKLKGNSNIVSYEDRMTIPHENDPGCDIMIRMELLTSLESFIMGQQFTVRDVIQLGIDICQALESCQKFNIIHRDIKPENIFVSDQGDFKLGDFGISRILGDSTSREMSHKCTPNYAAPEIFNGAKDYRFDVDMYSLGIVMYRLLNQYRLPFEPTYPEPLTEDASDQAFIRRMRGDDLPLPNTKFTRLGEIILKACSYDPDKRYSSPTAMKSDLQAIFYNVAEQKLIFEDDDQVFMPEGSSSYAISDWIKSSLMERLEKEKERTSSKREDQIKVYRRQLEDSIHEGRQGTRTMDSEAISYGSQNRHSGTRTMDNDQDHQPTPPQTNKLKWFIVFAVILVLAATLAILWPKLTNSAQTSGGNDGDSVPPASSDVSTPNDETAESGAHIVEEIGDAGYQLKKEYDGELLLKETQYHADGTLGFTYEYTYNEQGCEIEKNVRRADGTVWKKTVSEYNDASQLLKEENYENEQLTYYSVFEWTEDGQKAGYCRYNAEDVLEETHTFDYNEDGTYTETVQAEDAAALSQSDTEIVKVVYFYDVSGQMERQSDYDANDELVDYCEIKYDYRFRQTQQSWYYGNGIVEGHVEYKYSEDGSTTEETLYDANGKILLFIQNEHGADGRLTITQYDKERSIVAQEVYDEEGHSLSRDDYGMLAESTDSQ